MIERALAGEDQSELLNLTVQTLSNRVIESFNPAGDFTTLDAAMLTRLVRDTWQFSAAKNWQEMHDLSLALRDESGKLREFDDFKEAAGKIVTQYNETWMRTEYDFAVSASQNAARWSEFEQEANVIPNLRYQTVGDSHVRQSHRELEGIIRPLKDSFWNTHYPPNGWNCRCEAVQSLEGDGQVTPDNKIPFVPIVPMFQTNLAKTGLIYPKNHPYYNGVPKAEIKKALAYLPPKNTFVDTIVGDNLIAIHPLHGEAELINNITVANDFMNLKKEVKEMRLLPDIHAKDKDIKKKYYPDGFKMRDPNKNADSIIEWKNEEKWVVELKNMQGKGGNLALHIKDAYKKADYAIVKIENNSKTVSQIMRTVNGQMDELSEMKGIIVLDKDGSLIYEKYR